MDEGKIKVLYIAGWGRSGSTILARILGQIDGFFHGGELRTIWLDGLKPHSRCGCNALVRECPVWNDIFTRGFGGVEKINPSEMIQLRRSREPKTHEVLWAKVNPKARSHLVSRLAPYQQVINSLYQAIQATTHCQLLLDDSLHPGYAYTLATMPLIDLYLVHIVRDPRGNAYSWLKRKDYLRTYLPRDSAMGWNLRNLAVESLQSQSKGYLRVLYEDFAENPRKVIGDILEMVSEPSKTLPFRGEKEVQLGTTHSVFGNPNRMQSGTTTIKADEKWKEKLVLTDKLLVTTLTLPLMLKYGYSI